LKILHVANFSLRRHGQVFYAPDRRLSQGLGVLGHYVYDFSYRDVARMEAPLRLKQLGGGAMNRALLAAVDSLEPDLILWGHSESVKPETLRAIRERHPRLPMGMWYVDPLPQKRRLNVGPKLRYLNAFFATSAGPVLSSMREFGDAVLAYLPNVCSLAIDTGRAFEQDAPPHDLCYIGSRTPERVALIDGIRRAVPTLKVAHYGHDAATRLTGQDYLSLIGSSAMGLNYSRHNDISLYSSDRLIHLLANGAMVLTAPIPDLHVLFADDELVRFDSDADLHDKLRHYKAHPAERRAIAARGRAKALGAYNAARCAQFMIELITGAPLSERYEWQDFIYRPGSAA
jgi:Glycosyl transferases group 1